MSGELVARLRRVAEVTERHDQAKAEPKLLREAADRIEELERRADQRLLVIGDEAARIERMEAVLRLARRLDAGANPTLTAALDATLGTSPDTQSSAPNRVQAAQVDCVECGYSHDAPIHRLCPKALSWCGGPDRYGDTCAGCLATWTEEARRDDQ